MNIKDIARMTGVSTATVSRVINNSGYVKEETKKRILEVIEENNYVPNAIARSLCTQDTDNIGVVVPDIRNEFFSEVIRGITEELEESSLNMLLFNTDEKDKRQHSCLKTAERERLKGIIITPVSEKDEETRSSLVRLEKSGIPIVLLDRDLEGVKLDGVFADNYQGTYDGIKELIAQGHKKIAMITGPNTSLPGRERLKGYEKALEDAGIPIRKEYEVESDFQVEKSYQATRKLLELKDRPTAIFTVNNKTSLGCLKYLTEQNMIPGKDIALLGFDGIAALRVIKYPFSVVDRDARRMGKEAAHLLLEKINSNTAQEKKSKRRIVIPCEVELRGSEKYVE